MESILLLERFGALGILAILVVYVVKGLFATIAVLREISGQLATTVETQHEISGQLAHQLTLLEGISAKVRKDG